MKALLFEWLTSGGLWEDRISPDFKCSMLRQGREMVTSLAADFAADEVEVILPVDRRLSPWMPQLPAGIEFLSIDSAETMTRGVLELSQTVDHILLIAPECDSRLLKCVDWMKPIADKLISPDAQFVELASSKTATIESLQRKGFKAVPVGTPLSRFLENPQLQSRFKWPLVLKPDDGAGSEGVRLITDPSGLDLLRTLSAEHYRVESFVSGTPVSVSVLCGAEMNQILVPTGQVFDQEPMGEYIDAHYPLAPEIAHRAVGLAREAILSLPATKGYIGIDMVISDTAPQFDCLIEVNPRLTMSYLTLRKIYDQNLARLMLETATSTIETPAVQDAERPDDPSVKKFCIVRAPVL